MMLSTVRFAFLFLVFCLLSTSAHACGGWLDDIACNVGKAVGKITGTADTGKFEKRDVGTTIEEGTQDIGNTVEKSGPTAKPLRPVRAYLRAKEIPPAGAGAYGIVVFQSRSTPASREKLMMVCRSFVAYFPRSETSDVPIQDQMITIWPLDNPDSAEAKRDDCDNALEHYDLDASEAAITDAHVKRANFDGEGPYLVGWSPSNSRKIPDALVLVIDLSADITQAQIDHKFQFWKNEIVEDPSKWRRGFIADRIRESIRKFADTYGQAMLDAIKLVGEKKS